MKHIFGIFLALFVVSGAYATTATVTEVVDGDTFMATMANKPVRISLINVDTPELQGRCQKENELANKAKDRLMELIPEGTKVEVKEAVKDLQGKKIKGNVKLSDGRDIGEILIKEKLGRKYDYKIIPNWCE